MPRAHRIGLASVSLALGLAWAAGCQHMQPTATTSPATVVCAAPADPKPTDRQVADVQMALGRSLEKRGEWAQANAAYLEALRHDPKRTDAYARLAAVSACQGKFDESAELFKKALAVQPGNADLFCDMGYSLYLQGRWDEARMNLRQALALQPEHGRAHNNLGLVLARTGHSEEAFLEFRKAGCGPAEAHNNLAFALSLAGRWDEAQTQYNQALAANPASLTAKKGLREVQGLLARANPMPAAGTGSDAIHPVSFRGGPAEDPAKNP
jgi:Tfp pilus assembly protein PilF